MAPAIGAGAVAPAWPADNKSTGIPPRMHASMTWQASVANFIGGTTKQFVFEMKGRAPPVVLAARQRMDQIEHPGMCDGSTNEVPMCFVVPRTQA